MIEPVKADKGIQTDPNPGIQNGDGADFNFDRDPGELLVANAKSLWKRTGLGKTKGGRMLESAGKKVGEKFKEWGEKLSEFGEKCANTKLGKFIVGISKFFMLKEFALFAKSTLSFAVGLITAFVGLGVRLFSKEKGDEIIKAGVEMMGTGIVAVGKEINESAKEAFDKKSLGMGVGRIAVGAIFASILPPIAVPLLIAGICKTLQQIGTKIAEYVNGRQNSDAANLIP